VLAGACQFGWHGVGGFTKNYLSSSKFIIITEWGGCSRVESEEKFPPFCSTAGTTEKRFNVAQQATARDP